MKKISKIQYITNGKSADEIFNEVHEVIDAGVDWVQLRIKNQELDFLNIGEEVKAICKGRATLIINDQVSVAKDLDVEGVHLGLTDMPIDLARNVLGSNKIIGATANTILQCKKHYDMGANYIGLGPYKYTKTKEKLSPILGIEGYKGKNAAQLFAKLPVLAIGGIELMDVEQFKDETQLHGLALSSLISKATDKKEIIKKIKEIFF